MEQPSTKAIELVLELEYGYVLDELKDKDWEIIDVPISSVKTPYAKIYNKIVDQYTGDEVILCQTLGNKSYRLIDGNHRFIKAKKINKEEVTILTTKEDKLW
jgi:hypothetical protein